MRVKPGSKSLGHTLIEVMMACALTGICLLGIAALVRAGVRYLLLTNARTDLQRDALLLMRRLGEEFAESNDASFTCGNNDADNTPVGECPDPGCTASGTSTYRGVVFASPRSPATGEVVYDNTGRMFWPKYVCYFQNVDQGIPGVVRTVVHIPTPPPYPPAASAPDVFLAAITPPIKYKIMARNVTLFHCVQAAACMEVHIRMDLPSGYGRRYGFEVKSQVYTRN